MKHNIKYTEYTPIDAGVWPARCVAFVDMGTAESNFQGNSAMRSSILVGFEVYAERTKNGETKPAVSLLWKEFTSSLNEKSTLRQWLESWRGKSFTKQELHEFDFYKMIDVPLQISIVHDTKDEKTREKISALLPKGKAEIPERVHDLWFFTFQDAELNFDIFNQLPDWVKVRIQQSEEWDYRKNINQHRPPESPEISEPPSDDDIPF